MNNKENIYKEQLKTMFDSFEPDVPIDGWEKIEQSLNIGKRLSIIRKNWYIGSAAAIAVILITGTLFINSPKQINNVELKVVETPNVTPDKDIIQKRPDLSKGKTDNHIAVHKSTRTKQLKQNSGNAAIADSEESEIITEVNNSPSDYALIIDEEQKASEKENQKLSQEEIDRLIKELQEANNTDIFDNKHLIHKNDYKPLRLALNAKGGLTSSQHVANSPMTLRSATSEISDKTNDLVYSNTDGKPTAMFMNKAVSKNDAEMIHSQPIGVGITFSKKIIDRVSIETGISYTYLYSKSKNSNIGYINQESQHLHYLGIPLNINFNFIELGKVSLFSSIGGMIEKDIYGKYGRYQGIDQGLTDAHNSTSKEYIYDIINIKSPQYSINAGFGASYPIYGGFNVYAKIGGAYYFEAKNIDKNNYKYNTIYSDKKIMLDVNAGIRFDF